MADLIERQAAIDAIRAATSKYTSFMDMVLYTADDAVEAIEGLPPAQPERKKGNWKLHSTYHGDDTSSTIGLDWRCSECGRQARQAIVNKWFMYDLTDFCPNCGADMRGEQDE